MNILSYLSFTAFIIFVLLGIYCLKLNPHQDLNRFAFFECLTLAIWAFAYTFLYTATTPEAAMYWHRISCIGGSLFPPFAIYFFLVLSKRASYLSRIELKMLFYTVPILTLLHNLTSEATYLATGFVQSTSGLGWTYVNSLSNVWTWIYVVYLGVYFAIGFYLLLLWGNESSYLIQKKQALTIIIIDSVVLIFGMTTDILLPLFTNFLPPLANLGILLFAAGFFYLVSEQQLFSFSTIASSDVILDTVMDPVLLLDEKGQILRYNLATGLTLNYDQTQLLGKELNSLLRTQEYKQESLELLQTNKKIENLETELITSDGHPIHALLSAAVASDSIDGFMGIVVTFHDITLRKINELELLESRENYRQLADELYLLANYDTLTHLPNRRMFFSRLKDLSTQYPTSASDFALIFLDLNEFKQINDRYGHAIGDQVLIQAAQRLESLKQSKMMISRMGGDEFTLLIPDIISAAEATKMIGRIKAAFDPPIALNGLTFDLSISAGFSLFSQSDFDLDQLIRLADQRMYQDKKVSRHFRDPASFNSRK